MAIAGCPVVVCDRANQPTGHVPTSGQARPAGGAFERSHGFRAAAEAIVAATGAGENSCPGRGFANTRGNDFGLPADCAARSFRRPGER